MPEHTHAEILLDEVFKLLRDSPMPPSVAPHLDRDDELYELWRDLGKAEPSPFADEEQLP